MAASLLTTLRPLANAAFKLGKEAAQDPKLRKAAIDGITHVGTEAIEAGSHSIAARLKARTEGPSARTSTASSMVPRRGFQQDGEYAQAPSAQESPSQADLSLHYPRI